MMGEMNQKIVEAAEKQHGVTTLTAAALAAGRDAAVAELRSHRWERVGPGVYRLRGSPRTWEQAVTGLTLAAGPRAAASHRSAAALLGVPGFPRTGRPEVTAPRPRCHHRSSGTVHRSRALPDTHLTRIDGIVTTRVARTLVDLAAVLHPRQTERAVDSCLGKRMVQLEVLRSTCAELAARGRPGIAVMRAVLADRPSAYVAPESELEARFLALVKAAGLPEPVRQLDVGGGEGWIGRVDVAYPARRLLIELDGRAHHSAKLDREADAGRDRRLRAAGWQRVERVDWADVTEAPDALLARLKRALVA